MPRAENVSSFCVEVDGEVLVLDALAPPEDAPSVSQRLDAAAGRLRRPQADHVRDVDLDTWHA